MLGVGDQQLSLELVQADTCWSCANTAGGEKEIPEDDGRNLWKLVRGEPGLRLNTVGTGQSTQAQLCFMAAVFPQAGKLHKKKLFSSFVHGQPGEVLQNNSWVLSETPVIHPWFLVQFLSWTPCLPHISAETLAFFIYMFSLQVHDCKRIYCK